MSEARLALRIAERKGTMTDVTVTIRQLVIAGWTGRNLEAMESHIRELEHLGVARPRTTPMYYRIAAQMLTTGEAIQVAGEETSGEVEAVLIAAPEGLLVTVGSDHTDRKLETHGVTWSKQACPHPLAPVAWRFEDVADHWDQLILRSFIVENGETVLYQEGPVSAMQEPAKLIEGCPLARGNALAEGVAMFLGTHPAIGGVRPSARISLEIEDPVLQRRIRHGYTAEPLPIEG